MRCRALHEIRNASTQVCENNPGNEDCKMPAGMVIVPQGIPESAEEDKKMHITLKMFVKGKCPELSQDEVTPMHFYLSASVRFYCSTSSLPIDL